MIKNDPRFKKLIDDSKLNKIMSFNKEDNLSDQRLAQNADEIDNFINKDSLLSNDTANKSINEKINLNNKAGIKSGIGSSTFIKNTFILLTVATVGVGAFKYYIKDTEIITENGVKSKQKIIALNNSKDVKKQEESKVILPESSEISLKESNDKVAMLEKTKNRITLIFRQPGYLLLRSVAFRIPITRELAFSKLYF